MNTKIPKRRRARWVIELQQYDFEIIHRSGKENKNANVLLRLRYGKNINRGEILSENEQEIEIGIIEMENKQLRYVKYDDKWHNSKYVKGQKWKDVKKFTTKSFDRGLITPYGNHKMKEEIFKYKDIIDNAIVVFLENNRCWENYIGRENKKGDEGHKTSYKTLDKESYREMVEKFQINQHLYENVEKYKKIITNIDKEKKYILKDDKLYRVNKGKERLVIRRYEFEGLLYMMHYHELSEHFGINATYKKIKEKYYWKNMFEDIKVYVKTCDSYQRKGKPDKKNELFLIKIKREPFYQIGIDFVGLLLVTERKNRYIIVAINYFTKWLEARAIEKDNAETVAEFIYEEIICRHGYPQKVISDRGLHFNNKTIEELMKKFNIRHKLSTSYHLQTNGLVKRFNRTLCEALAKLGGNNEWDKKMHQREVRLPTDEPNKKKDESRIDQLLIELPNMKLKAKSKIEESQKKQKDYYDKRNSKRETYQIRDKVLKYNAAKEKQWSGKLEEKWIGSYYIHEILMNGFYKIKELNGRVLKTPINGNLLKKYYDRENFEPMVIICKDTNFSEEDSL
ncbi:hypothetical protein RclHR1_32680001 [Rhizophagus clarus]|uniref:Integrase catalytic domain-containing protein n=1 Tax=Rhizophagus clarus TaxID=94130 RepID=A0A2Z6R8Q7_9GLOM|nr:hypothetical protein RclHR1_32680001 [Rhizophagus clarus]